MTAQNGKDANSLKKMDPKQLAQYIDHTLLRPDASQEEILKTCDEALQYGFKGVCVEGKWLSVVAPRLKGSKVLAVTVVSFPKGNASTEEKVKETQRAVEAGADEVDMVLNRDLLKARAHGAVFKDIQSVVLAAGKCPVKVILETSELTQEEKIAAIALCVAAGAQFVKTSTGFSKGGATVEDIRLMRDLVGPALGVKASGAVRSYETAVQMIEAGATRIGTSSSIAIVQGAASSAGTY